MHDLAVVGGGPAGLALAILAARRGLSVQVFERQAYPVDKACGEGLMPAGVRELERLGVRQRLTTADATPFVGIRYVQEDGSSAAARFARGETGLGIRRTALSAAMVATAREAGAIVREQCTVESFERRDGHVELRAGDATYLAHLVVAADGLGSGLRRSEGMAAESRLPRRYGMRRHYRMEAWTDHVEVHFAKGVEAYLTGAGAGRVGVAFLWERGPSGTSYEELLAKFPRLEERLRGVAFDSTVRGSGPLARAVRSTVADRLVLLGDAAGYVDAVTGEGLTLAFRSAAALADVLPEALRGHASASALEPYARAQARLFRPYSVLTRALLWIAARPALRRSVVGGLARAPWLFQQLLKLAG